MTSLQRWVSAVLFLLVLAATAGAQPADIDAVMARLEHEGYFETCRNGDSHACSYFARLVVYTVNPNGNPNSYGALKKGGGTNVDGYAEDSIVLNANPNDVQNVIDLVGGTGAPGARIQWGGPHPRRVSDVWEAPRPLGARELAILKPGGAPPPPPTGGTGGTGGTTSTTNLQPVLDKLTALEALVRELHAKADAERDRLNGMQQGLAGIADDARGARDAADGASQAAADVVAQIDKVHQDVLVAIDIGKQLRDQSYSGRVFGQPFTIRPNRP